MKIKLLSLKHENAAFFMKKCNIFIIICIGLSLVGIRCVNITDFVFIRFHNFYITRKIGAEAAALLIVPHIYELR
jgi:hypothetical protein